MHKLNKQLFNSKQKGIKMKTSYTCVTTAPKSKLELLIHRKPKYETLDYNVLAFIKAEVGVSQSTTVRVPILTRIERNKLMRLEALPASIHKNTLKQLDAPTNPAELTAYAMAFHAHYKPKLKEILRVKIEEVRQYAKNNNHGNSPLMEKTRIVRNHRKGTRMYYAISLYNSISNKADIKRSDFIQSLFTLFTNEFETTSKKQASTYARHVRNELGVNFING